MKSPLRPFALFLIVLAQLSTAIRLPAQTTVTYQSGDSSNTARTTTTANPLTVTLASGTATEAGAITGDGSVTKTGAGTLTLSNTANSYTGGTTVSAGTLALNSSAVTLTGTGPIFVAAGATLDFGDGGLLLDNVTGTGTVTGNSYNDIEFNGSATPFTSQIHLAGDANLIIHGLNGGHLLLAADSTFNGLIGVESGATLTLTNGVHLSAGATSLFDDGNGNATGILNLTGGATLTSSSPTTVNYISGDVNVSGSGSHWTALGGIIVGDGAAGRLSITNGGKVTSDGGLTLGSNWSSASGTLIVSGAGSEFSTLGGISIGQLGAGSVTVSDGGKLGAAANINLGSTGSGTLNIGADITSAAQAAGIIDTPQVGGTSTGTLQFNTTGTSNAPVYFTRTGTAAGAGVDTMNAIALVNTAGYTVVTGTLAHTGGTTINGGTLQIGNGGTTGSLAGDITNNSTLVSYRSDASDFSGTISGTGSLTKSGAGTLTLTGANTYTDGTTISAGTLLANGQTLDPIAGRAHTSTGSGAVLVQSGGTLGGTGWIDGLVTVQNGGTLTFGADGNALTLAGGLTLQTGSILDYHLGATNDLLAVDNGVFTAPSGTGGVTINLTDAGGFAPATYTLLTFYSDGGATTSGLDLADFTLGNTIAGYDYTLALTPFTLELTATASAIPEPSTYAAALAAVALLATALHRRRRFTAATRN